MEQLHELSPRFIRALHLYHIKCAEIEELDMFQ